MAKVNDQDRHVYYEKIKNFTAISRSLLEKEKRILIEVKKNTPSSPYQRLTLSDEMLNLSSNYIAINGISQNVLKTKNEEALNDARKSLYKAVIYLEEVVSNYVDVPFSDYEDKLKSIESFDPNQRYNLARKMGLAIDILEQAYGDNSKWRWTFVEIEGRFAAAAKNMIDLKSVYVNASPTSPFYDASVYHLRLIKKLLSQAADRYREKYELSTGVTLDFKTGINFLSVLRRIHIVLAENEESDAIKKKLAIWSQKLETDLKKQEDAKKKNRV